MLDKSALAELKGYLVLAHNNRHYSSMGERIQHTRSWTGYPSQDYCETFVVAR